MKYYTKGQAQPAPIPFRIIMPDGSTRTDPSTFTPDEIAAAGYVEVPSPPGYNSSTQHPPQWTGSEWIVTDLTEQEILDRLPPYYETTTGIRLATGEQDQTAFSRMLAFINLEQMPDDATLVIKDAAGDKHGVSVAQFKSLMSEYGLHCYTLHANG